MDYRYLIFQHFRTRILVSLSVLFILAMGGLLFAGPAQANNQRAITIYDGERSITVTTDAKTIGDVLERADIQMDEHDSVEPSRDTPLLSPAYTVNIYRARPVTIVDGGRHTKVMSPYRTAETIVSGAGMKLYDEDVVTKQRIEDFVASGGPGLEVDIDRATPIELWLYGKKLNIRTQSTTINELLKEKDITLGPKDGTSKPLDTAIAEGMTLMVYRNGVRTKNVEKPVPFETRYIQDGNREVGYRDVKQPGREGRKTVTYEVKMRNGKEIARKKIASIVTEQPKEKVVIVGAKRSFSGGFADALAKLRACEGGYESWNPAGPYYGAYQFDQGTWAGAAPPGAEYGNATPAEQDQAARNLYEQRGWSPWPHCGASLPDIYR